MYNSGEYKEAIEIYDDVIKLENKGIYNIDVTYFNRGMAYYKIKEYEHAIGDFTNAINLKPRSKYYFNRANAYTQIGENAMATEDNVKGIASVDD